MCGIIGYCGPRRAAPILMDGLRALEYRGYDSAGLAVVGADGGIDIRRSPGKLSVLAEAIRGQEPEGAVGIGHTRWATHGVVNEANSHPHTDCTGNAAVAHNGIVENYLSLKRRLQEAGHTIRSQTDSEIIAHLVEEGLTGDAPLSEALRLAALQLEGAHAVVAIAASRRGEIAAFRLGNAGGLTVGYGSNETYVASDLPALLPHTQQVSFLESREMATLNGGAAAFTDLEGRPVAKVRHRVSQDAAAAVKGGFKHFMLKEIAEQPEVVMNALRGRVSFDPPAIDLPEIPYTDPEIRDLQRVVLVGMGTSWLAAQIGRRMMESLAGIPSEVDNAAEFRYKDPLVDEHTLVVSVGQSGETADTLAAMEEAQRKSARQITICNVEGSQAVRLADGAMLMRAGVEIGVAATKTFLSSLVCLYLLATYLGWKRGYLSPAKLEEAVNGLAHLPQLVGETVARAPQYQAVAAQWFEASNFLYMGRGMYYPVALEGALKLKEISYIHAEGYPAAEMKHGPIALVDQHLPVVALALEDGLREKMAANISEVRVRGGKVIGVITDGDDDAAGEVDHVMWVPSAPAHLGPVLATVPLQLFAYHIAVLRGCDVDQPRNLAKSVTVE